jgi:DNA-binding FrmR family transcriptional regulator
MKNGAAAKRLRTIQGHVGGIARMVDDGEYCIDVIRQIQAVQAALTKVSQMVLEDHMHHCLINVIQGDDPAERERVLGEIADVFQTANKS